MAGMGLSQAVDAYTQGVAANDAMKRMRAQQQEAEAMSAADAAYGAVHQKAQERLLAANPTGTYTPDDATEFEAAEARGAELAKRGLWKHYLQNEAMVQQQRVRVRSDALNAYKVDADPEKLVKTVYPTIFNGRKVVSVKRMEGAPAGLGFEEIPDKVEIELDDGTKSTKPVKDLVADLNRSLIDPAAYAEMEVKNNMAMALIKARGENTVAGEEAKAAGRVRVEEVKGKTRLDVEGVKLGGKREEIAGRERVATIRAGATLGAAGESADARRYAADRGVDSAGVRAGATLGAASVRANAPPKSGKPADAGKEFDKLHAEITKIAGDNTQNLFGGKRVPTEDTLKITRVAEQAIASGMDRGAAMQGAIEAYARKQKASNPKAAK